LPPLGGAWEPVRVVRLDAAQVRPGDVLLTGPGLDERVAGRRQLAEEAFARQAVGVVTAHRTTEPWAGTFVIHVADASEAITELARWIRHQYRGVVAAVTGDATHNAGCDRLTAYLDRLLSTSTETQRVSVISPFDSVSIYSSILKLLGGQGVAILAAVGDGAAEMQTSLHRSQPDVWLRCTDSPADERQELRALSQMPRTARVLSTSSPPSRRTRSEISCQLLSVGTQKNCDFVFEVVRQTGRPSLIRYEKSTLGVCRYDLSLNENFLLLAAGLELGMTVADIKRGWRTVGSTDQRRTA